MGLRQHLTLFKSGIDICKLGSHSIVSYNHSFPLLQYMNEVGTAGALTGICSTLTKKGPEFASCEGAIYPFIGSCTSFLVWAWTVHVGVPTLEFDSLGAVIRCGGYSVLIKHRSTSAFKSWQEKKTNNLRCNSHPKMPVLGYRLGTTVTRGNIRPSRSSSWTP